MQKRILYCATVDYHFKAFHLPYMKWFQEQGWEVHVAAKGHMELPYCSKRYELAIERSPLKPANLRAYRELKTIIESNRYNIIHAHTPMGGLLARLAAKEARKNGTKVLYTAHGFHFHKGAPPLNWIIYYPLERWLARFTDCLITINGEDYDLALKHDFRAGSIVRVHGVGVDTGRFHSVSVDDRNSLRQKHGYRESDFLLYYAAELNRNKNQELLIKAISKVREKVPGVRLLLAGEGERAGYCRTLAKRLAVGDIVDFIGFRNDMEEIANMSDIAVASSLREGLPVNIMEAMACGKPVVATDTRGHRELVRDGVTGWLVPANNAEEFSEHVVNMYGSADIMQAMGEKAQECIWNTYSIDRVFEEMTELYQLYGCNVHEAVNQCDSSCLQCREIPE